MVQQGDPRATASGLETSPARDAFDSGLLLKSILTDVLDYGLAVLDPNGYIRLWSAGSTRLFGYRSEEILGAHVTKLYLPQAIAEGLPARELDTVTRVGRFEDEGWRLRADGSQFWASVVVTTLHDEDGKPLGHLEITRDLSDRRQREEQLQSSEERFRRLIEGVRDYAIFTLDAQGYVTSWNAGARLIKGYEAHEIIGSHFSRFYPAEAVARSWPEHELRVATLDGRFEDEGWRVRKDGTNFWASVVITALRDAHGTLRGFSKITRDLSERRRQDETQRRSEERFRLLVEGVRDYALYMLDPRGFVASWNAGAERIHGWPADAIIGKHYSHFFPADDVAADRPWHELEQARSTGSLRLERWRVRRDGTRFLAKLELTRLRDAQGELYGYAHLTQDLTLERRAAALENVAERMNEFLGILAHELRNPLAPIRNAVMLMQRKGLGEPVLESMRETIDRQSRHLERIVNDLLDVSRVARGELTIERQPLVLAELLPQAIDASRPVIEARGHRLHLSVPEVPLRVSGDLVRLNQVVVNLLNNAAKYMRPGGDIWLQLAREGVEAVLRVRDAGVGIRPEMHGRIFTLFAQDAETLTYANGGLGVGLALVRRVVELHGGRIEARSEGRDHGSEFVVHLPLLTDEIALAPRAVPSDSAAEDELPRRRVLIADDNVDAATTLAALLQALGQDTLVVHDGMAALEAARRMRPDLILLDIGMPTLNGYEVATALRAMPEGEKPLLVAVTGWGQEADRLRAEEVGFDRHFVKPVSVVALRRLLADPLPER